MRQRETRHRKSQKFFSCHVFCSADGLVMSFEVFLVFLNLLFLFLRLDTRIVVCSSTQRNFFPIVESWNCSEIQEKFSFLDYTRTSSSFHTAGGLRNFSSVFSFSCAKDLLIHFFIPQTKTYLSFLINLDDDGICTSQKILLSKFSSHLSLVWLRWVLMNEFLLSSREIETGIISSSTQFASFSLACSCLHHHVKKSTAEF